MGAEEIKLHENPSYVFFRQVMENIYNHPFVTHDSRKLRSSIKGQVRSTSNNSFHPSESAESSNLPYYPIVFLYGSVARGTADEESDIDYIICHETTDIDTSQVGEDKFLVKEYSVIFDNAQIADDLSRGHEYSDFPPLLFHLFYPAVGEFHDVDHDPEVERTVFQARKLALQVFRDYHISREGEEIAEQTWNNHIRKQLNNLFLPNLSTRKPTPVEMPISGEVVKDTEEDIRNFRAQVFEQGPDAEKIKRFFDNHDNLEFPDWETMKKAFNV